MKKVNVSEFRDATDHLNQLDKDYHACVGVSEAFYWVESAERMLRVYLDIECSRANDEDRAKFSRAATKLFNRIENQLVVVKESVDKAMSGGILRNKEKCDIILSTLDKISNRMGDNKTKVESKSEIKKTPEAIKKVNVSQFRGATEHLYRLDTNFHACVNVSEKFYWLESAERMLREYLNIDCSRAKDDDRIEYKKATTKLFSRIEAESVSVKSAVDNSISNGLLQDKEKIQIILSTLEGISKRLDGHKGKIESFAMQPKVKNRECDVGMGM
ncbi:hypothetical protein ACTG16_22345 [Aeromonas sp. 23P]|uniref:hypothetical protein n=1 Tax=Aeromonas sp. 23P TaxID=3452716 RepID=UPI003F7A1200